MKTDGSDRKLLHIALYANYEVIIPLFEALYNVSTYQLIIEHRTSYLKIVKIVNERRIVLITETLNRETESSINFIGIYNRKQGAIPLASIIPFHVRHAFCL